MCLVRTFLVLPVQPQWGHLSKADDEGASGREDEATSGAGTGAFIAGTVVFLQKSLFMPLVQYEYQNNISEYQTYPPWYLILWRRRLASLTNFLLQSSQENEAGLRLQDSSSLMTSDLSLARVVAVVLDPGSSWEGGEVAGADEQLHAPLHSHWLRGCKEHCVMWSARVAVPLKTFPQYGHDLLDPGCSWLPCLALMCFSRR